MINSSKTYRKWEFNLEGKHYAIEFFYSFLSDKKELRVNGVRLAICKESKNNYNVEIQMGNHIGKLIQIDENRYDLLIDGKNFQYYASEEKKKNGNQSTLYEIKNNTDNYNQTKSFDSLPSFLKTKSIGSVQPSNSNNPNEVSTSNVNTPLNIPMQSNPIQNRDNKTENIQNDNNPQPLSLNDIFGNDNSRNLNKVEAENDLLRKNIGFINDIFANQNKENKPANKISNTLQTVKNIKVSSTTISNYLNYLTESFLFSNAKRYDVKGKKYFEYPSKYYCTDIGLRNARLNFRQYDPGHIMENILYCDLKRRGYSVDVGVVFSREIDKNKNSVKIPREIDFVLLEYSSSFPIIKVNRLIVFNDRYSD